MNRLTASFLVASGLGLMGIGGQGMVEGIKHGRTVEDNVAVRACFEKRYEQKPCTEAEMASVNKGVALTMPAQQFTGGVVLLMLSTASLLAPASLSAQKKKLAP